MRPGSSYRDKARVALARAHARVADSRRDFHHKTSTRIIRDNQAVYAEDLRVAGLGRTRLAKSVHDAGVVSVRVHAGVQGPAVRPVLREDRPVGPVDRAVFGVRRQRRP